MTDETQKALESAGYRFGTVQEFLGLTEEENAQVEGFVSACGDMIGKLRGRFPGIEIKIVPSNSDRTSWRLFIMYNESSAVLIDWHPFLGFNVSSVHKGGRRVSMGAIEFYEESDLVFERVEHLIISGASTNRPREPES